MDARVTQKSQFDKKKQNVFAQTLPKETWAEIVFDFLTKVLQIGSTAAVNFFLKPKLAEYIRRSPFPFLVLSVTVSLGLDCDRPLRPMTKVTHIEIEKGQCFADWYQFFTVLQCFAGQCPTSKCVLRKSDLCKGFAAKPKPCYLICQTWPPSSAAPVSGGKWQTN